jgi:hypothetical protein
VKIIQNTPPREYRVGKDAGITIRDCAHIELSPDEQITLTTPSGTEFDVLRKSWGYYATPSLNGRLPEFHLHAALVRSPQGRYYLVLVEKDKRQEFLDYIAFEKLSVTAWLDSSPAIEKVYGPSE